MRDPRRLVEEEGTEFERRLLLSAQAEQPPPEVVSRMERALGITAVVALGASGASAASAASATSGAAASASSGAAAVAGSGTAAASASAGAVSAAGPALVLKTVGLAALVLAGAVTTGFWLSRPVRSTIVANPRAPAAPVVTPAAPAGAATAPPTRTPVPPPLLAPAALPTVAAAGAGRGGRSHPGAGARGGVLRGEIALIDGARTALAGGSPVRALQILRQHDARYPRGALVPEAQALRIEALARSGQRRRAQALARAFIAAYPDSPLAERIARVRDGQESP